MKYYNLAEIKNNNNANKIIRNSLRNQLMFIIKQFVLY